MKKIIFILVIILIIPFYIYSEESEQDEEEEIRSIVDVWKDVLLYGIDSEVLETIVAIRSAEETSLNNELAMIFAESYNLEVRKSVISYFQLIEYEGIIPQAEAILENHEDENKDIIIAILYYLSHMEAETDQELLKELIDDSNAGISTAALKVISTGPYSDSEKVEISLYLIEKLEDSKFNEDVKPEIIIALGELGCFESVDKLLEIVEDTYEEKILRMYAADALGKIGDVRAVPALKEIFSEQDALLKAYAASALSNFDAEGVVDILMQGLRDSNWRVRLTAAKGLGEIGATEALDILIYKAKNDPENVVKMEAITAIGKLGVSEAYDFIREVYADDYRALDIRSHCLEVLIENDLSNSINSIKELVEKELVSSLTQGKILEITANQIFTVESSELKDIFALLINSTNLNVRLAAIRGIANNRYSDLKDTLETLSEEDPASVIKETAIAELENW